MDIKPEDVTVAIDAVLDRHTQNRDNIHKICAESDEFMAMVEHFATLDVAQSRVAIAMALTQGIRIGLELSGRAVTQ